MTEIRGAARSSYNTERKVVHGATKVDRQKGDSPATLAMKPKPKKKSRDKQADVRVVSAKGRDPGTGREDSTERGGGKREGAEPEPPPHTSPTAFKFLSAADCVLHVFPWT